MTHQDGPLSCLDVVEAIGDEEETLVTKPLTPTPRFPRPDSVCSLAGRVLVAYLSVAPENRPRVGTCAEGKPPCLSLAVIVTL